MESGSILQEENREGDNGFSIPLFRMPKYKNSRIIVARQPPALKPDAQSPSGSLGLLERLRRMQRMCHKHAQPVRNLGLHVRTRIESTSHIVDIIGHSEWPGGRYSSSSSNWWGANGKKQKR